MSVTVTWLDDNCTKLCVQVRQQWSWDALFAAVDDCFARMDDVDHKVYTIFDFSEAQATPDDTLDDIDREPRAAHTNGSTVILVGSASLDNPLMKQLATYYDGYGQTAGMFFFTTISEANRFLNQDMVL